MLAKTSKNDLINICMINGLDQYLITKHIDFTSLSFLINTLNDMKLYIEEIKRRYLRNCTNCCPSCLEIFCNEELRPLQHYVLDKKMLRELLIYSLKDNVIEVKDKCDDNYKLLKLKFIFLLSERKYFTNLNELITFLIKYNYYMRNFMVIKLSKKYLYLVLMVKRPVADRT